MRQLDVEVEWDDLDAGFAALEAEVSDTVRGLTVHTFETIVRRTPQFEGRLAASWTYSLNAPVFVDRSHAVEDNLDAIEKRIEAEGIIGLYKGHATAVNVAYQYNRGNDLSFKLGDTVYFANGADHGEGAYSQAIEDAPASALRAFNRPGRMVARTLDLISSQHAVNMSFSRGQKFKAMKIGGGNVVGAD